MFGRIIQTSILLIFIILSQSLAQDSLTFDLNFTQKKIPFGLTEKVQADLPKVGLALSGGGARGFAQIGVLRAFVENDIPISSITGTSMGSIIGALYVSGYSFDEIDSILINSDWQSIFSSNEASRKELYVEDKITEDRALVTLRLNGLKPILPNSILTGQKVENFLNILAINAPINFYTDFNDFLIPYQAITSDLISGDAVVFKKGSLAQTLRASSSVTLLLPPVKVDSMLLVDGGLVANIPTEYAKKDGSDIIVAVNTTSALRSESELNVPFNFADQILSVSLRKLNEQQLSLADVIISPIIDSLSNNDFKDSKPLIKEGFLNGKKALSSIRSLIENHLKNIGNEIAIRGSLFPKGINYKTEKDLITALSHYKIINKSILEYELSKIIDVNSFSAIQIQLSYTNNLTELGIKLNENHSVNYLEIKGESLLDEKTIKVCSDNLVGKPYNQKELMNTVLDILRKYRKKGYSLAVVKDIKFDELGNLTITIDEGIIDKIELVGNEKTRDDVILREFPLNENQLFNIYDAKVGLDGLRSIKLFESSELVLKEKNGKKIVSINIKEKPSSLVRFGLRVDNENFTQASIDIRDENLFGSGTDLGLIISGGIRNGKFSIEHKANRIFNTYFTYKLRAFYDYQDVITYRTISGGNIHKETREKVGEYSQSFLGVSIGLGTQVQKFGNIIIEGKYHINEVKELNNFTGSVFRTPIFSLKFGFIIDSKDKYPYPNSGTFLKAYYETAQKILGGEIAYSKMDIQYQSYFAINNSNNISPKVVFGFADETLPLSQYFSMGGQYSFFGMRDFERRGRQIFVTSLEYRYLLPIKLFFDSYFKFRYDLGSVWESREQIRLKDLRHGVGLSLSIDTPIGPAEFSAGKTFRISEENLDYRFISSPWNFYFRIGYYY